MRWTIALLALAIPTLPACEGSPAKAQASPGIWATGFFGSANVHIMPAQCAGRVALTQGTGDVKDSCFTGDTNIVLCTDVTSINPVRCTPHNGSLSIGGTGSDVIAYGRLR